jgi:hypothetical protein
MLYDDLEAGNRVMRVVDALTRHCGAAVSFHSDMWKFDTLRCGSISQLAAQDAREADVVIVSAHGAADLPQEVKEWFPRWTVPGRARPVVLVAILDHTSRVFLDMEPTHTFLAQVARQAGMEFMAMTVEEEDGESAGRHALNDNDEPPPLLEAFCRKIALAATAAARPGAVPCS